MSQIRDWLTVPVSNSSAPPDGAPELMTRSGVNDTMREIMASVKLFYDAPDFRRCFEDYTLGRITGTNFTMADGTVELNASLLLEVGQRVRIVGDAGKVWEGWVADTPAAPTYSAPTTTLHVEWIAGESFDVTGPTSPTYIEVGPKEIGRAAWYDTGAVAGKIPLFDDLDQHVTTLEADLDVGLLGGQDREAITLAAARQRLNVNGGLDVWQRGTTFTAATPITNAADNVCADGFTIVSSGNDRVDIERSADTPGTGEKFRYSMRLETVASVTNKYGILVPVEAPDAMDVASAGNPNRVSFSFWAKFDSGAAGVDEIRAYLLSAKTESPSVTPVSGWSDGSQGNVIVDAAQWEIMASAPITMTSSWQRFAPAALENVSMDVGTGVGTMAIMIVVDEASLAAGSRWFLTGLNLVRAENAVPFVRMPFATELERCQRYYESTFDWEAGVRPGHAQGDAHSLVALADGTGAVTSKVVADWRFKTRKFRTPTLVTYNPTTASPAANAHWRGTTDVVISSSAVNREGAHLFATAGNAREIYRIGASAHANIWGAS